MVTQHPKKPGPLELRPLSRSEVQNVDRRAIEEFLIPGLVLMENAGRGAAELIAREAPPGPIGLLCGKGNNAGDGYVVGRHLQLFGREPTIIQLGSPETLPGDAATNWKISQKASIPTITDLQATGSLAHYTTLVDAILGTGSKGPPRNPFATAIQQANRCDCFRVAIDVPSGLDCDSGIPHEPCFRAARTITFVSHKRGFLQPSAAAYLGDVQTVSIGVPRQLLASL